MKKKTKPLLVELCAKYNRGVNIQIQCVYASIYKEDIRKKNNGYK